MGKNVAIFQVDILHTFLAHQQEVFRRLVAIAAVMVTGRKNRLEVVFDLGFSCFRIQSEQIIRCVPGVCMNPKQIPDGIDELIP